MDRLREIAWLFFRLGLTAFGGPAAQVAMMDDEFVSRRQWISRRRFLDLIGATNLSRQAAAIAVAAGVADDRLTA